MGYFARIKKWAHYDDLEVLKKQNKKKRTSFGKNIAENTNKIV